ncbi:hypothetical protein BDV06DRAFT_218809 [Aspergillus oleicola]
MAQQTILGYSFFSQEDVQLASLIPNIEDIDLDALESVLPLQSDDFTTKEVDDFTAFFGGNGNSYFQAFLAQVASWTMKYTKQADISLAARKGRIYTLRKPGSWFRRLCEQAQVRTWLQEQIEDGNDGVYFVVGLHTLVDAATSDGLALTSERTGGIAVSASNLPLGSGVAGIGQIALSAGHERSRNTSHSCTVPGEQIFALRLKKVILRTWRTQDVADVRLAQHSHWVMASDNRSSGGGSSELLEAFIEGDSEGDDYPEPLAADACDFVVLN